MTLAFDSMHCKGRFGMRFNNTGLVAFADDAIEVSIIKNELKVLADNEEDDQMEYCHS